MVALVERPDLSLRTALSKSALATFDLCQHKAWNAIHNPRPFVPNEKVSFGSAVDAGVETILKYARMGQPIDMNQATEAAEFCIARDDVGVDITEVQTALAGFVTGIVPKFDWAYCALQENLHTVLEGLGECDGHPDIVLADNSVWDVKTSARTKEVPSVELGFYTLLREETSAKPVPRVGYLNWVRAKRPYWVIVPMDVTDEFRRWTYERAAGYVRAKKADQLINAKAERAQNFSFAGGPRFPSLCTDCEFNPANGGSCLIAMREIADVA